MDTEGKNRLFTGLAGLNLECTFKENTNEGQTEERNIFSWFSQTNIPEEVIMETKDNRWLRVTVLPGCVGCRTVAALESWTVREVKECILAETGFPVSEQRLWLGDREIPDCIKIGDLSSKNCHLFVNLQSKGLKGGGITLTLPGDYAIFS